SRGSLYKTMPLAGSAVPLLLGTVPGCPAEPVAWVNSRNGLRVFFTSLGHPGDFASGAFRRLLRNAIFWALDRTPASGPAAGRAPPDLKAQPGARPPPATGTSSGSAAGGPPPPIERGQAPLAPSAALATFKVAAGLQLELVLAEPVVRQPVSLTFDERGR